MKRLLLLSFLLFRQAAYAEDNFSGAVADKATKFPKGFKPRAHGIIIKQ